MARCIIAPLFLVLVVAQDTSSPACTEGGHSLMQTKRNMVSAEPAASGSSNQTVPIPGLDGAPVLVMKANFGGFSRLVSRPHLLKGGFCRSHPCSLLAPGDKRRGLGATAAMHEAGYEAVAKLKDDEEMKTFILRVIKDYDCHVDDDGGLMGIVPWFSGTTAVQSLEKLEESLLFAVLANGARWLSFKNTAGSTGGNAPLDLEGYMEVAIIRSDIEMESFARRLADQMGIKVTDEGGFAGMIKYHSGEAAFQSFDKLQSEIKSAAASPNAWAKSFKNTAGTSGGNAPLDLEGYMEVATIRSDIEMETFARRLAEQMGIKVTDEGGFAGMIKDHTGEAALSFDKLQSEIKSAAASPHSWAKVNSM